MVALLYSLSYPPCQNEIRLSDNNLATPLRIHWEQMTKGRAHDPARGEQVFESLLRAYQQRNRHYHNAEHLAAMFGLFDQYRQHLERPDLVAAAIFFHDVVYNPARHDNEAKSAAYAAKHLPALGFTPEECATAGQMILATQKHELPAGAHPDLPWLLDFDLAILGAGWETYLDYTRKIRREYRIYPDMLYKPGRRKAMEHFLQRPVIFQTPAFRDLYEAKARENIGRELANV